MVTDFLFVCITFSLACIGHSQECKKHVDFPLYYCDPQNRELCFFLVIIHCDFLERGTPGGEVNCRLDLIIDDTVLY